MRAHCLFCFYPLFKSPNSIVAGVNMAEPLKNYIDKKFISTLASFVAQNDPTFSQKQFTALVLNKDWSKKELKARVRHLSLSLGETLTGNYKQQVATLKKVVPHTSGLGRMVFPDFVEVFGQEDFKTSLSALQFFTPYFSSEFAIRPFIKKQPQLLMKLLATWSTNSNEHIRRLASEGCRPRLPWSFKLQEFIDDPQPVLKILENLKNDPSLYVRKSVANNLNDISKDHPELVLKLAKQWIGKSEHTDWILKHALRTLLKKGNQKALKLFGVGRTKNISVQSLRLKNSSFKIGSRLEFSVRLLNNNKKEELVRVEYAIHYLKKSGGYSKKVFKMTEKYLQQGIHNLERHHSLCQMTTRKHIAGVHVLDIVVNGETQISQNFRLK
jgi:3-methyladenine DNA glycosylase AlkC